MLIKGEKSLILLFENWMVLIHLKLNPHHPRMLCTKFGSWEDEFLSLSIYFHYYLPLEKSMILHLNKDDFPSPKDALYQVWLKLALWFLRRRFLKFVNVFSLFPCYPLGIEKGRVLHSNKLESSSPNYALCQVWWKLVLWFLIKRFLKLVNVFSLFRYYVPL